MYIGNIEFYKNFNTIDDKFIERSNIGKKVNEWISYPTRAKVVVNASELKTAIIEGYDKISTAVDIVALRTDLSFPKLKIGGDYEFPPFHYDELVAHVTIPVWVYCRENDTDLWIILNLNFSDDNNILKIGDDSREYFSIVNRLFSDSTYKNMIAQDKKSLLLALHWVRRSIEGDKKDKMLDLWTAMELVISGAKTNPLFCDELIESIIGVLTSNRESLELTNKQEKVLTKKLESIK